MSLQPLFVSNYSLGGADAFPMCNNWSIPAPSGLGIEVVNINAVPITDFSFSSIPYAVFAKSEFSGLSFCNISVEYTHPGYNDSLVVYVLLPPEDEWNGKLVGAGGGGWSGTNGDILTVPVVDAGYSVMTTNAGVPPRMLTSEEWALLSVGNPDINRLNTFSSRALHDMAMIGKSVTRDYYGQAVAYSYWVGCSQGGRQGMMNAQRYPDDYDGIVALAPAVNWAQFHPGMVWAQQIMHELDYYPQPCEVLAFTAAAVEACDELDGIADGIVSLVNCPFNPFALIGKPFNCSGSSGTNTTFTENGARVMHAAWQGPRSTTDGFLWYGYHPDANLQSTAAGTTCSSPGNCTFIPFTIPEDWLKLWVANDPSFSLTNLSRQVFQNLMHDGVQRYDSIISTRDADLSRFRDNGGKIITWHGMSDEYIPVLNSVDYYDRVRQNDENVTDYFRMFLAPGTPHCAPGNGHFPIDVLSDLENWVEQGNAPTHLNGHNISNIDPTTGTLLSGSVTLSGRPICPYPLVQRYMGGNTNLQSSFECIQE
jgi:pimeloyl-ACP methyl ester carboxylesterase